MLTKVPTNMEVNKGAWTAEEDRKLSEIIALHGARRWKTIGAKAGLNRGGKSCRLRWMNYLRPNIKRGNISDQEEDLILRLHKLLGNRWSLIAGRLPGRTDNEIKNYWNSHLSKKINHNEKPKRKNSTRENFETQKKEVAEEKVSLIRQEQNSSIIGGCDENSNIIDFDVDDFFDFPSDIPMNLEWVSKYLGLEEIKFK